MRKLTDKQEEWLSTFFHITTALSMIDMDWSKVGLQNLRAGEGCMGVYELAKELTNEFEKKSEREKEKYLDRDDAIEFTVNHPYVMGHKVFTIPKKQRRTK